MIDGNVLRVISRIFGVKTAVDSSQGKKEINKILLNVIDKKNPGVFNQATMELGALICKPLNPLCEQCMFMKNCYAYNNNGINFLPVKEKRIKQRDRFFNYLFIKLNKKNDTYIYINKRTEKDIWTNLYDFPLIETEKEIGFSDNNLFISIESFIKTNKFIVNSVSKQYKHKLSHQTIYANFIEIELLNSKAVDSLKRYQCISIEELHKFPIPKLIDNYIKDRK